MEISENSTAAPGGDILFARLAFNLLESGDVEEATKVLEKGLRFYPSYAQAHYILAKCYMKQHLTDEARAELERVLRYDPNHANATKDLSSIYFINGFQDLYKEYLLKLFTLNPLNEEVVDEVKKLGEYKLWSSRSEDPSSPELNRTKEVRPAPPEKVTPVEFSFSPATDNLDDRDLLFPGKVDLSQFDNVQDDFTTILHGNLELPQKRAEPDVEDLDLLKSKEEIFGGEIEEVADEVAQQVPDSEEILESMDDMLGDDEELVIQQIKETDNHLKLPDDDEMALPGDKLSFSEDDDEITDSTGNVEAENAKDVSEEDQIDIDKIIMQKSPAIDPERNKSTEADHPITDFDHLQDEEDEKFEQPKIISQTLGEILVSQKKYSEAKSVFEALKEKTPNNKSLDVKIAYLDKIIGLEKKAKS